MSGIGVIVNPRSRRNRGDRSSTLRLARIVGDTGVVAECSNVDDLHRAAEDFQRQKVSILAIGGGDGTNSVTTTGFYRVYGDSPLPSLALLRGGTMNVVANSVGVPRGTPESILGSIVRRYRNSGLVSFGFAERTTMDVNGTLGFMSGAGIVHGFLAEYYSGAEAPTPWKGFKTLMRAAGSAFAGTDLLKRISKPVRGQVTVDGKELPSKDYLTVIAGTIQEIGLGFRPWPRAYEESDKFQILAIHASPTSLAKRLHRIYRGQPLGEDCAVDLLAREAVIDTGEREAEYMIDGDLHRANGPLTLRVGPRVRILVPHSA